uniref:Uncharacterized protein n=1 Tax=Aegilops tauschii subsp. strangulata TaxID=200361 RepID=A0A453T582_AEGTS
MGLQDPKRRHHPEAVQRRGAQHWVPQEPCAFVKGLWGTRLSSCGIRPLCG